MLVRFLLFNFFLLFSATAFCQTLHQALSGVVKDKESLQPIPDALLILEGGDTRQQAVSDSSGSFIFPNMPPGRYRLLVSHIAYAKSLIPEIQLKTSRPERLTIYLQEQELVLAETAVQAKPLAAASGLHTTLFTIEETQRFPATFFDPARLMTSQPGVTTANDQANQLSVHGQSPNFVSWQLEGAEILNPNHLPNAGTFSDRAAPGGGGVNILSGQLMGNSRFYSGALPAHLGNAIGGLFDISLREGSREQHAHTLQASLLGIDLATEGPLNKEQKSSYLVNYRYSTVGLLSSLGVDFGNEEIQFQDLAFHLNIPTRKAGEFSVFGIGGLSSNDLFPVEEVDEWEKDKDRQEVRFEAGMGAFGLRHSLSLGQNASLFQSLVFSSRFSDRQDTFFNRQQLPYQQNEEAVREQLLAYKGILRKQHTSSLRSTLGLVVNRHSSSLFSNPANPNPVLEQEYALSYTSLQPFGELRYSWSAPWLLNAGLRLLYDTQNKTVYPEPRLELMYALDANSHLQLSYNLLSQPVLNQPFLLPAAFIGKESPSLAPIRSHYSALGYEKSWRSQTSFQTKVFYQYFYQVPVSLSSNGFSALNAVEELATGPVGPEGEGQVYGLDASLQRYFTGSIYYLLSLSLFDATYRDAAGEWHNMRFNSQYALSFTGGKEWTKEKQEKQRTLGLNLRALYRGGYWHTPIHTLASGLQNRTVFDWSNPYAERLPGYFSLDLRLSNTKQKRKYLRTWSLDIQNLLNRENISWYYFDHLQGEVRAAYQLGIIPVLGYRIEF